MIKKTTQNIFLLGIITYLVSYNISAQCETSASLIAPCKLLKKYNLNKEDVLFSCAKATLGLAKKSTYSIKNDELSSNCDSSIGFRNDTSLYNNINDCCPKTAYFIPSDTIAKPIFYVNSTKSTTVKFIFFNAKENKSTINLLWAINQENNTINFVMERSIDNENWIEIGQVSNAINTISKNKFIDYKYTDFSPALGKNNYRIKYKNSEGKFTYSSIKSIDFNNLSNTFTIYPNPAKNYVKINWNIHIDGDIKIRIMDYKGNTVLKYLIPDYTSTSEILPLDMLRTGIYFVEITKGDQITVKRLIVQDK